MRSYLLTGSFWAGTFERAVRTAAQTLLALWGTDQVMDAFRIDYKTAAGVALLASMLSVLMSIVAAPIGPAGPSMVNDRPNPAVPGDESATQVASRHTERTATYEPGRATPNGGGSHYGDGPRT